MKKSKLFFLVFFLFFFTYHLSASQSYVINEEQYQALLKNWYQQEEKFNLLDSQLLTLTLQLQQANEHLKKAEEHSQNSENQLEKAEESLKKLEDRYAIDLITAGSIGCATGIVITVLIFLFVPKK